MTKKQTSLCERLKQLGFKQENQMRLYGEEFELLGDPLVIRDDLVFVDAIEKKSGQRRRVRIPLSIRHLAEGPLVSMANGDRRAA
jgi:hypothetical protein